MASIRKEKGDIAAAKVIADLTEKGYFVFTPAVSEHARFDMIAYKDNKCYRIQAKYSSSGCVYNKTVWNDKNGSHTNKYVENDFDYYGLYLPSKNIVIYPHLKYGGSNIRMEIPNSPTPFYWYEDFLCFTDNAVKRHVSQFESNWKEKLKMGGLFQEGNQVRLKQPLPKDVLENLMNQKISMKRIAKELGVSDELISKWVYAYNLDHLIIRNNRWGKMGSRDPRPNQRKVERPSKEELAKLLWEKPTTELAKQFGVSDVAISKWAKAYGLSKPPRGYWMKLQAQDLEGNTDHGLQLAQ